MPPRGKFYIVIEEATVTRDLKLEVAQLRADLAEQKLKYDRLQSQYGFEVMLNFRVLDYCQEHGLNPPKDLYSRSHGTQR